MEKSMKEEWRPVRGKEEYAEISNLGQIHYFATGKGRCPNERFTYGCDNGKGYLYACIGYANKGVHVWLYETFYDCDIPKGYDVNHIDEDKHNNRLDNLNLLTHGDNMRWGTGVARSHATQSKAVQALDPATMEVVMEFPSTQEAQRQGFDAGSISRCCRNCFNRPGNNVYKGFIWRFKENKSV